VAESAAASSRHDVHAPDLTRPLVVAADAAASHRLADLVPDDERAVRRVEVAHRRLAARAWAPMPLQQLLRQVRRKPLCITVAVARATDLHRATLMFAVGVAAPRPPAQAR
jgi:hypothetical protein